MFQINKFLAQTYIKKKVLSFLVADLISYQVFLLHLLQNLFGNDDVWIPTELIEN